MSKNYVPLKVKAEDKEKLMNDCVKLFLKDNPDFKGVKITQHFMFNRVVNFYINPKG